MTSRNLRRCLVDRVATPSKCSHLVLSAVMQLYTRSNVACNSMQIACFRRPDAYGVVVEDTPTDDDASIGSQSQSLLQCRKKKRSVHVISDSDS